MSDVPADVMRDILLRLPADSLIRFRAVCKSWCRLIDTASFVQSHAAAQISSTGLLLRNTPGTRLFSLSLDSINFASSSQTIDATPVKMLWCSGVPRLPQFPVPACNGLVIISKYESMKPWIIWNPLTREFHEVPLPDYEMCIGGNGLGYDFITDDYKVVCIDRSRMNETHVYSLKQKSWRRIENCPSNIYWNKAGLYVKGALYWTSSNCLVVLDLTAEVYRQVPVPPGTSTAKGFYALLQVVDDGLLAYSQHSYCGDFDVWVMKENEVWTKLFSRKNFGFQFVLTHPRLLAYWEKKGHLVFQERRQFFWCDIMNPSVKIVMLSGLPDLLY